MPIPLFDLNKMNEFDSDADEFLKMSLGVQKQNSFMINSSNSYKFKQLKSAQSVSTQTDDFTNINNLFQQAKIYEIPVQMQILELTGKQNKEVQTNGSQQICNKLKIQDLIPAVRRQNNLQMQSGLVSINIVNFSFQKDNYEKDVEDNLLYERQQSQNQDDKNAQYEDELLLSCQNDKNKQILFQTARFQHTFNHYENNTPPKLRISGSESSPDTNGMRMSEREINMMQMISAPTSKIDEDQYQHFQSKFYALQEDNNEKNNQIILFQQKISSLQQQLCRIQRQLEQKQSLERDYKILQKQLQIKNQQYERAQYQLQQIQIKYDEIEEKNSIKTQQLQDILFSKQSQIQQLLNQINLFKLQYTAQQEKLIKQNQNLQTLIHQKQTEINELRHQHDKKYEIYIISIKQMKQKITQNEINIEKLQEIIHTKDQKIAQIKAQNHKLKQQNSILNQQILIMKEQINRSLLSSSLKQNHQNSNIYQNNFQLHKTIVSQHKLYKINQQKTIKNQKEFTKDQKRFFQTENTIAQKSQKTKNDEMQQSYKKIESSESQDMKPQQATIFIENSNQTSKFVTYSFQKPFNKLNFNTGNNYIQELQKIILIYENIIDNKIATIEELEQKVLEFLKDALVKQNQAQLLYSQLCQYENSMNGLLVEKLDMQLENQRLKKMICESQSKLSILGSRLIKLAKTHSTISFMDPSPYSNSSVEQKTR